MTTPRSWPSQLYLGWKNTQTPVILSAALLAVGIVALILGDGASKSFANLGGAVVIRIMGALLVIGGSLTLSSLVKASAMREVCGLVFLALGAAIYGGGVMLGLHNQGLISSIGYAGITITLLDRIADLVRATKQPTSLL
jgi:hypothetical protein